MPNQDLTSTAQVESQSPVSILLKLTAGQETQMKWERTSLLRGAAASCLCGLSSRFLIWRWVQLCNGEQCLGLCYLSCLSCTELTYHSPPIWGKCLDFTNSWSHLEFFIEIMGYFWGIVVKLRSDWKRKLSGLQQCFSTHVFLITSTISLLPLMPINLFYQTKLNSTDTLWIFQNSSHLFMQIFTEQI